MKILFVVIPEKGHINPMIGVAQHLRDRGHSVGFYAGANIQPQLDKAGLGQQLGPRENPPPASANRGAEFADQIQDAAWLRHWIEDLLLSKSMEALPDLKQTIADFAAEVVVTDPMVYPAAIAAHSAGVPWVAISNSLNPVITDDIESELLSTVAGLSENRTRLFTEHGMPDARFSGCDLLSPLLTIAFTTKEFVGEHSDVELVGPSHPLQVRGDETDFPWQELDGRRKLFVSFGSQIYYQPTLFQKIFTACATLDVQVIAAMHQLLDEPDLIALPSHVLAVRYAPQLELLKKVDGMITHGGANSVMEAMAAGVPLMVAPLCNDQFHQAHFVERCGNGCTIDLATADIATIREACKRLLDAPDIRQATDKVALSYAVDGAATAATLVENSIS